MWMPTRYSSAVVRLRADPIGGVGLIPTVTFVSWNAFQQFTYNNANNVLEIFLHFFEIYIEVFCGQRNYLYKAAGEAF